MTCHARRVADQMECRRCALVWDASDPEPPACAPRAAIPTAPPVLPPSHRAQLAARLRRAVEFAALSRVPEAVGISSTLARDLIAELEKAP